MEYYSAIKKNTFESILMKWMKLEPIIQSEVSQKEKHQYSILTHIYGIYQNHNEVPLHTSQNVCDPKVCSLHLCLLCSITYSHCYHLSKFHIYVIIYYIGVFLSDLLILYNQLQFHPPH